MPIDRVIGFLNIKLQDIHSFIHSFIHLFIHSFIHLFIYWFNKLVTNAYDLLPPNLRPNLAEGVKRGANTIECVFNKIISKLLEIAKQLLLQIIDRYVNAPLCAIESFVGSFFATILGEITSGIQNAIAGILGPVGEIASVIFLAVDILIGILNFLSCEEDLDCQMIDEWNFFTGSQYTLEKLTGATGKKIQSFVNNANNSAPPCSTGQLPCGPPTISFFGSGTGATGNPVISATGYILGVDLLTGGRYTSPPDIKIIDGCGIGAGAVLVPIMEDKKDGTQEVVDVVVVDPGFGYLSAPNGSTGGDGTTFSGPSDTIIFPPEKEVGQPNSRGIRVLPPNKTVKVSKGEKIFLPNGSNVPVFDPNGNPVQELEGKGQLTSEEITEDGNITTPDNTTETFEQNADSYQILICIEDLAILNEGVNYSPGDEIIITPDNGTVVDPILDEFGKIIEVNMIAKGCGFTDFPEIRVQSETGINAVLNPIFSFRRIDDLDEVSIPDLDTRVVNVIDCVGKLNEFSRN